MLKKKIIPVFLASVLAISGTAGFSAGIVSENVYASEEAHTQRLSDFADLLDANQEEELETKLNQISEDYDCDIVKEHSNTIIGTYIDLLYEFERAVKELLA